MKLKTETLNKNNSDNKGDSNNFSAKCPVCSSPVSASKNFMDKNYDHNKINDYTFASRKTPEFMCHKLVLCKICDVVYAIDPPDESELSSLYHEAAFDSDEEANDASEAYINSLNTLFSKMEHKKSALEIGTGTGIFLEKLKGIGFKEVIGIEPSTLAIEAAPEYRKDWIINDIFKTSYFKNDHFSFIGCFMTMEHVKDPMQIARDAFDLLADQGVVAFVVHDHGAIINRILGKKSPIIDIEHLQLFSKKSIRKLLNIAGYKNIYVGSFKNTYALSYWVRLMPIPNIFKNATIKLLKILCLSNVKLSFNVGNLLAYGHKDIS